MIFQRTEQQNMLEQALGRFVRERYDLVSRQAYLAEEIGFNEDNWRFFAEMGLLGLPFSETEGGFGGTLADVSAVMRLLGKGLVVEPYLQVTVVAGRLLSACENNAFKTRWLEQLISGEKRIALAHLERSLPDACAVSKTRLQSSDGQLRLNGSKCLVPSPFAMDLLLVSARDEKGGLAICAIEPDAPGVSWRHYRTADGHRVADANFNCVEVAEDQLLGYESTEASLDEVITYAHAALCGETVGIMEALTNQTEEYAKTRKQFGQPIGHFQVIKHRLVDAKNLCLQADCMALMATQTGSPGWAGKVAAARAYTLKSALDVGHEAIQIHGGMGLTDELSVSHYHKRLVCISRQFNTIDQSRDRFIECVDIQSSDLQSPALDFKQLLSTEQAEHHKRVEDFLERELDEEIALAVRRQSISWPDIEVAVAWQQKLEAQGWLAPLWPVEFGGTGWSAVERFIFEYESGRHGAPEQIPMGFRYVGPVIAKFGSSWQKSFFLPKLLSSEHQWAQGFSEPGAGSDLAAIKTTAVCEGEDYIVDGSKMWTTNAHVADWLFCLVRTGKGERPQQGISFLLIDMQSPGVRVEPIRLLAVDHEVNQVFFDNVRVPRSNLVGEEGCGWDYAKYLLELERGGTVFSGRLRGELNHVRELVSEVNRGAWSDRVFTHRMVALEERLMALELYEFRAALELMTSGSVGVAGSIIKLLASELQKDITELAMNSAGHLALELCEVRPLTELGPEAMPGLDLELVVMPRYLNMRVASIYGGSSEVQREIIAKHLLGLR